MLHRESLSLKAKNQRKPRRNKRKPSQILCLPGTTTAVSGAGNPASRFHKPIAQKSGSEDQFSLRVFQDTRCGSRTSLREGGHRVRNQSPDKAPRMPLCAPLCPEKGGEEDVPEGPYLTTPCYRKQPRPTLSCMSGPEHSHVGGVPVQLLNPLK